MVDEDAGTGGLEAQDGLFTGIDDGQCTATQPAGCGVKIDVVLKLVGSRD